ncbi:MAG: hypothetical protein ACOCXX_04570 [Planctomycetota bacterium]
MRRNNLRPVTVVATALVIVLPGLAIGLGGITEAVRAADPIGMLDGVALAVLGLGGATLQVAAWCRPAAARAASWCCLIVAIVPLVFLAATVLADVSAAEALSWDYYRWFGGGCLAATAACGTAWWLNRQWVRPAGTEYVDDKLETRV